MGGEVGELTFGEEETRIALLFAVNRNENTVFIRLWGWN